MPYFLFRPLISSIFKSRHTWPTYLRGLLLTAEGGNTPLEIILSFLNIIQDKQLFIPRDVAQVSMLQLHIQLQFLVPQDTKFSIKVYHQCIDLE